MKVFKDLEKAKKEAENKRKDEIQKKQDKEKLILLLANDIINMATQARGSRLLFYKDKEVILNISRYAMIRCVDGEGYTEPDQLSCLIAFNNLNVLFTEKVKNFPDKLIRDLRECDIETIKQFHQALMDGTLYDQIEAVN